MKLVYIGIIKAAANGHSPDNKKLKTVMTDSIGSKTLTVLWVISKA